jgi:fatty acid desaturase
LSFEKIIFSYIIKPKKEAEMKKALKIILGIALIAVGAFSYIFWYPALWIVFKGCIGAMVILAGIICLML